MVIRFLKVPTLGPVGSDVQLDQLTVDDLGHGAPAAELRHEAILRRVILFRAGVGGVLGEHLVAGWALPDGRIFVLATAALLVRERPLMRSVRQPVAMHAPYVIKN